jgi:hypothetical protein
VPEQYRQLADGRLDVGIGRLDVGIGRAVNAPPELASHLFRHDPLDSTVDAFARIVSTS